MKTVPALLLALGLLTALPTASAQFTPSTNLLPQQDRDAVREGQQMSLGQIYDRLRQKYGGGNPVDARRIDGERYFIRWEVKGRIKELMVSSSNGQVLSERG